MLLPLAGCGEGAVVLRQKSVMKSSCLLPKADIDQVGLNPQQLTRRNENMSNLDLSQAKVSKNIFTFDF